jgi:PEGA domain
MRVIATRSLFAVALLCACAAASSAAQQGDCGRPVCPNTQPRPPKDSEPPVPPPSILIPKPGALKPAPKPTTTTTRRVPRVRGGRGAKVRSGAAPAAPAVEEEVCEGAELLVRAGGIQGCVVMVDGRSRGLTNDKGELLVEGLPRGQRTVAISKQGYNPDSRQLPLACGASETVNLSLRIQPVRLRIRTSPPEAEVFVNDPPVSVGRSDARGLFEYTATTPRLLVTARKQGYLDDNSPVNVDPAAAQREIVLTLKAIPARLSLTANVAGARARVDGADAARPLNAEPISLPPGPHRVEVDALGYAPASLELTAAPDEVLKRAVTLERLPAAELVARAEAAFRADAYEDVLTLCGYALEADDSAPAAHRLEGMVYLVRQDYANAEPHLAAALAGGETIELHVRRHQRESFDQLKGHDACEGFLYLGKSDVEYRGRQVAGENFKVPYAQAQVVGLQLKKNVAVYLGTKISEGGKKQDYNFYSFDRELTAAGRPYLEMIQRLMRPH